MPFRSYRVAVEPGKPQRIFRGQYGDEYVWIRSQAFGGVQASSGFTFVLGGPELEDGADPPDDLKDLDGARGVGFSCFSGEWDGSVGDGDEVWADAEENNFQPLTPLTILVRSRALTPAEQERKERKAAGLSPAGPISRNVMGAPLPAGMPPVDRPQPARARR